MSSQELKPVGCHAVGFTGGGKESYRSREFRVVRIACQKGELAGRKFRNNVGRGIVVCCSQYPFCIIRCVDPPDAPTSVFQLYLDDLDRVVCCNKIRTLWFRP